jgi:hypothetical protein
MNDEEIVKLFENASNTIVEMPTQEQLLNE